MSLFTKKWLVLGMLIFSLGFFSSKGLLTGFMERNLQKSIKNEAEEVKDLWIDLAPLGFLDLLSGNIRGLSLSASRLAFQDGPAFEDLNFISEGMKLDPNALWFKRKMEVQWFERAELSFRLSEEEITKAISADLPQWEPNLSITPAGVRLEGKINIMGRGLLPFYATVQIEQAAENTLRLTPIEISIAGINFLTGIINNYRQELTWEYPVHVPWPLRISSFRLNNGFLEMKWKEKTMGGG